MTAKYILQEKDGEHWFELIAPNGRSVIKSNMYNSVAQAMNGIEVLKKYSWTNEILVCHSGLKSEQ